MPWVGGMEPHYGLVLAPRSRPPLRVLEGVAQRQYFVPQLIGPFPPLLHPRFISFPHKSLHLSGDLLFGGGSAPEKADDLTETPKAPSGRGKSGALRGRSVGRIG